MDTLHERLAELADEAPTGGALAAELWVRGKRAHRLRAAAVAATVLMVGAVGTGIGVSLADGDRDGSAPEPAGTVGVSLPIEYPVGRKLPSLGDAPGPLTAIWVIPKPGGAPEVVGLVAETGAFGTLSTDALIADDDPSSDPEVVLSPGGRWIAYNVRTGEDGVVLVHDLVSGEKEVVAIENEHLWVDDWFDATHLYGNAGSTSSNGWVWEPDTGAKLVDFVDYPNPSAPYLGRGWPYGGPDLEFDWSGSPSPVCARPPVIQEVSAEDLQAFEVSVLCDVVGVVGSEILLGHWNSEHVAAGSSDPSYPDGTVVALDIHGTDRSYVDLSVPFDRPDRDDAFDDPALRRVVVTAGAPYRVDFATDLIAEALEAEGGGS